MYGYEDLLTDPHLVATGTFVEQPAPDGRPAIRTVRPPIRMSESDVIALYDQVDVGTPVYIG